jgi:Ca-activated chloride channel family protein
MFEFAWWMLLFTLPLPLLVYLLIPAKAKTSQVALYFPHVSQLQQGNKPSNKRSAPKFFIMSLAWIALVLACARPIWFGEPISIPSEGRDLMLAVDLSGSMQQTDMLVNGQQVDRLDMVKSVMDSFIERRVGDRIGLILFADTAYLQTPLTFDRSTVNQLLDESVIGLVGDSTAIGDAIGLAVKRFSQKERSNRVLVLLTDGRNTAGNITVEQSLELAIANKVTIYSIGVGAEEQIQNSFFGQRRVNPSMDLDERTLIEISRKTGGEYFRARSADELEQIYGLLDVLEPVEGTEQTLRPRMELYYYPMLASFALAGLLALLPLFNQLLRRIKKLAATNNEYAATTAKSENEKSI